MLTRQAPKGGKWRECGHSDKNTALFAPGLDAAQLVRHVKCLKKKKRGKGKNGKWREAGRSHWASCLQGRKEAPKLVYRSENRWLVS